MCNPTASPRKAKASSTPSARSVPPSPASTPSPSRTRTSSSSSSSSSRHNLNLNGIHNGNGNSNGIHKNMNNTMNTNTNSPRETTAPILKLLTSLRNSEEGSPASESRGFPRSPRSVSQSMSLSLRNPSPDFPRLRRRITLPTRPGQGQESRDDSHPWRRHPDSTSVGNGNSVGNSVGNGNGNAPSVPPFFRAQQDNNEEEDEIPCLIDEEDEEQHYRPHRRIEAATTSTPSTPTAHNDYEPWRKQRQSPPSLESADSASVPSDHHPHLHDKLHPQRDQKEGDNSAAAAPALRLAAPTEVPFFLLEGMLEDLVPAHQNAQDLAKLLRSSTVSSKEGGNFSPLRKSKSCGLVESDISRSKGWSLVATPQPRGQQKQHANTHTNNAPSPPILQRLLPWSSQRKQALPPTPASPVASPGASASAAMATMPPMPVTPKSSNRKTCKVRNQKLRVPIDCLVIPRGRRRDINGNDNDNDTTENGEEQLLPRNLNDSLEDCGAESAVEEQEASLKPNAEPNEAPAATSATAVSLVPKLAPRVASSAPQASLAMTTSDNASTGTSKCTKKSASCPQFYQDDGNENGNESSSWKAAQLRKRAQEQLDRRERRSKLTIVQRSMTLAQGWNNKGLCMAGRATSVEQLQQQRRQQQQHSAAASVTEAPPSLEAEQQHQEQEQQDTPHGVEQWWESSLGCWDNALEIYRSLLGEYHERVADVQNNRGIALGKLGRYEEALGALGMALEARKKQEQRERLKSKSKSIGNHPNASDNVNANANPAAVSAAIVSILHNIANIFRDAGNPTKALGVLVEAQNTLLALEQDLLKMGTRAEGVHVQDRDPIPTVQVQHDCHHCWHQSARLSTAIGHIYYESEAWRDAREAYGESLEVYERLLKSLSRLSDRLGWGSKNEQQQHRNRSAPISCGNPEQDQMLELLHHQQSIQREVSVLEKDLDELDRRQQARDGSRARLLQARRQQQQQQQQKQRHDAARRMPKQQQQQQSLFGIVSNLRA